MKIIQNFKNAPLTAKILSLTVLPLILAGIIYFLCDPRAYVIAIVLALIGSVLVGIWLTLSFIIELVSYTFFGHIIDGAIFFKKKRV